MRLCSNASCRDASRYKVGETCRGCGLKVVNFGIRSAYHHIESKRRVTKKITPRDKTIDIAELTERPKLPLDSDSNKTDYETMEDMAKVIIDQNESLIHQDKLILKALAKQEHKQESDK